MRIKSGNIAPILCVVGLIGANAVSSVADDLQVAHGFFVREEYQLAVEKYQEFLEQNPIGQNAEEVNFYLAESYSKLRDEAKALAIYQRLVGPTTRKSQYFRMSLFRLGERSYNKGDFGQAAPFLQRFLDEFPKDEQISSVAYLLGESLLAIGDLKGAHDALQRAANSKPAANLVTSIRYSQAKVAERMDKIQEAQQLYEAVSSDAKSSLADDALFAIGVLEYQQGKYGPALKLFEKLPDRFPKSSLLEIARLNLGLCHYQLGQYDRAVDIFGGLVGTESKESARIAPEAWYRMGLAYLKNGEKEQAIAALREGAQKHPKSSQAADMLFEAAWSEFRLGRLPAARAAFEKFTEVYPDYGSIDRVLYYIVRAAQAEGQNEKILAMYQKLAKEHPQSLWRDRAAVVLAKAIVAEPEMAPDGPSISELLESTTDLAARHHLQYYAAASFFSQEKYSLAVDVLQSLLKVDLEKSLALDARYLLGTALVRSDRWQETIEPLENFLASIPPKNADSAPSAALRNLGEALAHVPESSRTRQSIEKLLDLATKRTDASELIEDLAEQQYLQNRYQAASGIYQRMLEIGRKDEQTAKAHLGLGWCLHELGKPQLARQQFESAKKLSVKDPALLAETYYMIGVTALELESTAEALEAFRKVFADFFDSEFGFDAGQRIVEVLTEMKELQEADRVSEELVRRSANSDRLAQVLADRAWLALRRGKKDRAMQLFRQCVRERPASKDAEEALLKLAELSYEQGNFTKSLQYTDQLQQRKLDPDLLPALYYRRGMAARKNEKFAIATAAFETLVSDHPEHRLTVAGTFWLGQMAFDRGNGDEAIEFYRQVTGRTDSGKYLPTAILRIGQAHLQARRWNEAYAAAQQLLAKSEDPQLRDEALFVQGQSLHHQARFDNARERYARILRGDPTELAAKTQFMIGETFFHQERFVDAKKAFLLVEIQYDFPQWQSVALLELGKCYERLDPKKAVKTYERLLERFRQTDAAKEAEDRLEKLKAPLLNQ